MKKIAYSIFIVTLLVGAARIISFLAVRPDHKDGWTTFQKHPHHPNLVRSHASTDTEKHLVNINTKKSEKKVTQRAPSSTPATVAEKLSYKGREIFNFLNKDEQSIQKLEAINSPSDNWKGLAAGKLLRFQDPSTKLFIMPEKSVVKVEEQGARFAEIVQVKFLKKNGKKTSYSALIDSQSGELIRSWNQSISDSVYSRKDRPSLTTGSL